MVTIKIGLLSDTHIPTRARVLPARLTEIFQDADYIIHAGDYVNATVIEDLQKIAPVVGCYGNMDPHQLKNRLPRVAALKVDDIIIKVVHDLSGRFRLKEIQKAGQVDVIVHGHTHKKSVERVGELLIINPGSATNSFYTPNSIGILYLMTDQIDYELIDLQGFI